MNARELFGCWADVRAGLHAAIGSLSEDQLDFRPREGLWSIRETLVHIAGTEDGWLRCYTANRWHENPPRPEDYPTKASIVELLERQHAVTEAQFGDDPDAHMARVCQLPWGAEVPMGWAVWHVIEHEIHHRGEVYLMLGLLGMEAPDV